MKTHHILFIVVIPVLIILLVLFFVQKKEKTENKNQISNEEEKLRETCLGILHTKPHENVSKELNETIRYIAIAMLNNSYNNELLKLNTNA